MANMVLNIALGRVAEIYNRVDSNDPTNSVLVVVVFNAGDTDATIRDTDTIAAIEALVVHGRGHEQRLRAQVPERR